MTPRRSPLTGLALGELGFTALLVGVWALGWPRGFYDRFPGIGAWVAGDGPFNEHLVRDVGGLNLSLAALTCWAWRRPEQVPAPVVGWVTLVAAVPHLLYHAGHLQTLASHAERLSSLAGLLGTVVCAAVLVVPARPQRRRRGARDHASARKTDLKTAAGRPVARQADR
ncbi:hypothetical protein LAJ19_14660 (plasmid) [Deinococcus taeanensis]|uniref:hypothetical protein n=1 Tax=Deinococcus taeanensis TaxID=2737050 RepID=UPI001CDC635E|nr:hypothetical protein [Deinococcus taeanensis]UBV44404.1 hypothetical protein LAJ19_14660 [Deinococcus taeanensis]